MRPVVALDVDGVLNPDSPEATADGFVAHELHVPAADVPDSPFIRGGGDADLDVTVLLHPAHGAWITELREHADVVWATTWEHAANIYLAPLLGIEPLPVGISVAANPPRFEYARKADSASWKRVALSQSFAGRPLVWVDDLASFNTYDARTVERVHHLVNSRSEQRLADARTHRWDDDDDFAPRRHFEDTWADGGYLVTSAWSYVATGLPFRYVDGDPDPSPTMVVMPAGPVGLTPEQMEAISSFVREHAAAQDKA